MEASGESVRLNESSLFLGWGRRIPREYTQSAFKFVSPLKRWRHESRRGEGPQMARARGKQDRIHTRLLVGPEGFGCPSVVRMVS